MRPFVYTSYVALSQRVCGVGQAVRNLEKTDEPIEMPYEKKNCARPRQGGCAALGDTTGAAPRQITVDTCLIGSLGSRVVSVLVSGAVGSGFKSQPRRCRVTVLGKLFTPIVPLFAKQRNR